MTDRGERHIRNTPRYFGGCTGGVLEGLENPASFDYEIRHPLNLTFSATQALGMERAHDL